MFEQIEHFKQQNTDVRFNIWESDSINIINLLNERKLDIAYIPNSLSKSFNCLLKGGCAMCNISAALEILPALAIAKK